MATNEENRMEVSAPTLDQRLSGAPGEAWLFLSIERY